MASVRSRLLLWRALTAVLHVLFILDLPNMALAQDSSSGVEATIISSQAQDPSLSSVETLPVSSTSSAPAQTHTIQVGLADHKIRPEVTTAEVGDVSNPTPFQHFPFTSHLRIAGAQHLPTHQTITFTFYPKNHSIVRAEYGYPCIPYEMTGSSKTGFFSAFQPVDTVLDTPPSYSIVVNDTEPIFVYCSAPGSCITYGMVAAINPNSSTSIDTQRSLAMDSAFMLSPGEPWPAESPLPTTSAASSTPGRGDLGGGSNDSSPSKPRHGLSVGAIAGIAIAGVAVLVLAALLFFFWGRTRSLEDEVDRKASDLRPHLQAAAQGSGMQEVRGSRVESLDPFDRTVSPLPSQTQTQEHSFHPPSHFAKPELLSPTGHPAISPSASLPHNPHQHHQTPIYHPQSSTTTHPYPHPPFPQHSPHAYAYPYMYPFPPSPPSAHHRAVSPPTAAVVPLDYGAAAPSYFESVVRPGPRVLNEGVGVVEMEGDRGRMGAGVGVVSEERKWEEVDERGRAV